MLMILIIIDSHVRNISGIESENVSEFQSAGPSHLTCDLIVLLKLKLNLN